MLINSFICNITFFMKKLILLVFFIGLISCGSDDDENQFLPNVAVNVQINLNLPQYHDLLVGGGSAYANGGIKGIIIYNTGTSYVAFDRACPHLTLQACAQMTVESIFMVCPCDSARFQIIDGAPENGDIRQAARFYNVTKSGNTLFIRS